MPAEDIATKRTEIASAIRRRAAKTIAFVAFVAALTSCGATVARVTVGSDASTLARRVVVGDVTHSSSYPGFEATLGPAGNVTPRLTAAEAIALCGQPGSGVSCQLGQPASIELGLLTDAGMGIEQRLVWAISWDQVNCMLMGPMGRPSPPPSVNDASGCNFVTFVDATTGANPMAILGAGI